MGLPYNLREYVMLAEYFDNLEQTLKSLQSNDEDQNQLIAKIKEDIRWLRFDLNDMHAIFLIRETARRMKKENLIAFIGTGQINENGLHAFIYMSQMQKKGFINKDIELLYVAATQSEYDFLNKFQFDGVELWKTQAPLAKKIMTARTIISSTHRFSIFGKCGLAACISNPTNSIQLWHGLPAKRIGAGVIRENTRFHQLAHLLNDVVIKDFVFIENEDSNTQDVYKDAFPNSDLVTTGSIRLHILFNETYRQQFLAHKQNQSIQNFVKNSTKQYKVLYCPTYRENQESKQKFFEQVKSILQANYDKVAIAIKLHPVTRFNEKQQDELHRLAKINNHLMVEQSDEVYSSFPDFDAIITDYSSIRMDFAILGKPVFLYQFDKNTYPRETDVINLFSELDQVSYHLSDFDELSNLLQKDEKRAERDTFVKNRLKDMLYNDSADKVTNAILNIHNQI